MPDPNSVISQLWHPDEQGLMPQVYTILDAARNENIYPAVMDFDGECCCLFRDDIPEVLARASPYLLKLKQEDDFTTWLIIEGWGDSWGIFLESSVSFEELSRHFRGLVKAREEDGEDEFFFRYYDPRVLRAYLPTCNEAEKDMFFGPVSSFFIEDEHGNTLLKYSRDSSGWSLEMAAL